MLRLDAEKFGTAEYYEATGDGERPRVRRRLAWYGLGFGIAVAILFIHPSPQTDLFLGSGDRLGAVLGGIAYGVLGIVVAVSFATYRYHRIRFPDTWSYPGALLNSTATAFIDEVAFRGALFGLLLLAGVNPTLANFAQALIYTLTTRLGAPRPRPLPAGPDAGHRAHRRLADGRHRRDRRGLPGPRDHPLRGLPVHRPHRPDHAARPRGRGDREAPPAAGGLAGHRVAGVGFAGPVKAERVAKRVGAVSPAPPVALYVHVPFCVSLCPYCDFVVFAGAAARGPAGSGSTRSSTRSTPSSACGPTPSSARSAPAAGRRSRRSTWAAGRRRSCRPTRSPRCSGTSVRPVRHRR